MVRVAWAFCVQVALGVGACLRVCCLAGQVALWPVPPCAYVLGARSLCVGVRSARHVGVVSSTS